MRDDSPYYEPQMDSMRHAYIPADRCACCGSTEDLGPDSQQDYTLCPTCRKADDQFWRHSITCHVCGQLTDEREAIKSPDGEGEIGKCCQKGGRE